MAWIESHQELRYHYKTKRLARELKVTVAAAVGHLHFLWWWAVDFAPDGDLTKFDDYEIADAIGYEGKDPSKAKAALISAGFLDNKNDGTVTIHDWYDYAGKTIEQRDEKRRKDRERKARISGKPPKGGVNKRTVSRESEASSGLVAVESQESSGLVAVLPNRTEHDITEPDPTEQDVPPSPPASGGKGAHAEPDALERQFEEFWTVYPKKQGKGAALKAWKRIKPDKTLFDQIIASVEANISRNEQWHRDAGQYIPNPATWLNQTRWLDEVPTGTGRNVAKTAADYAGGGRPSFTELAEELAQELENETGVSIT